MFSEVTAGFNDKFTAPSEPVLVHRGHNVKQFRMHHCQHYENIWSCFRPIALQPADSRKLRKGMAMTCSNSACFSEQLN
ncbi:hypothetical protein E2C01_012569 [Portunus trituberculatus]|uniref:Uncharacterized protein n=1 Tax=Portunus trituberculatus TaxID=210409 RepID=A0A5B7DEY4_PORTR|nr:hypothetical protein [Portunus trituberculatus]